MENRRELQENDDRYSDIYNAGNWGWEYQNLNMEYTPKTLISL